MSDNVQYNARKYTVLLEAMWTQCPKRLQTLPHGKMLVHLHAHCLCPHWWQNSCGPTTLRSSGRPLVGISLFPNDTPWGPVPHATASGGIIIHAAQVTGLWRIPIITAARGWRYILNYSLLAGRLQHASACQSSSADSFKPGPPGLGTWKAQTLLNC
jgi:hypothetical protein